MSLSDVDSYHPPDSQNTSRQQIKRCKSVHARLCVKSYMHPQASTIKNSLRPRLLPIMEVSTASQKIHSPTHFFSFQRARRPTPATLTTLNRTPGISPLAFPRRPKPEMRTSSFSSVCITLADRHWKKVMATNEVQTTVVGDESGNLLTVLDELNSNTLSDSRVGLLGLNTDLITEVSIVPLKFSIRLSS